jgi:ubiquinone/menaquinone biosynthesis C-methylase UbiE
VESVIAVDPSAELLRIARKTAIAARVPIELRQEGAEALSLGDGSVETVVMTWTLCSIPDRPKALREAFRVLVPDGRLLFAEHGSAPDPEVMRRQDRITPVWRRCSGGCHLNVKVDEVLREAGFQLAELRTGYAKGLRPFAFMYEGVATKGPSA